MEKNCIQIRFLIQTNCVAPFNSFFISEDKELGQICLENENMKHHKKSKWKKNIKIGFETNKYIF